MDLERRHRIFATMGNHQFYTDCRMNDTDKLKRNHMQDLTWQCKIIKFSAVSRSTVYLEWSALILSGLID